MNILYFFPYDGTFMTEWQRTQIFAEMAHYGVYFEIFNPLEYGSNLEANERLYDKLREEESKIDLFMNCASSDMLFPETMNLMKDLAIPKLLICFDNLHAPFMHKSIASYFDLVWLTSHETEFMFKKWGCKTIFQPYASNPFLYCNRFSRHESKVAFVGTPYGTRSLVMNKLVDNNVPIDVYYGGGTGRKNNSLKIKMRNAFRLTKFEIGQKVLFSRFLASIENLQLNTSNEILTLKDSLSFQDMNKVYSNYALSLNIIELLSTALLKKPIYKLHLRTFEIPMSAGLELVAYNNELINYFSEDEMVFYHSYEDMAEKAIFYTTPKAEDMCKRMKLKAREKAEREHCWRNRFAAVLGKLNIGKDLILY